MEENRIGPFIRDRRLQLEMTQQQLADKLGVTDKAVSKWERSVSYPDITILRELSDALEVSVTELLAGEREHAPPVPPEVEDVVVDTVAYAETARRKNDRWRWWTFVVLTICCLTGALVCFIFYCITRRLWTVNALRSIAFGWAVCYPLLRTERPVRNALIIASVGVYPFIRTFGAYRAWHLGIVVVSAAYAWMVYWIAWRYRQSHLKATVLILLLGGLLHCSVNLLVGHGGWGEVFAMVAFTLALDVLCLGAAWVLERVSAQRRP